MRTVEEFVHKKLVVLHMEDTIQQAARAMCDNRVGCVIVADRRGHFVGLVTDRDLACYPLAFDMPLTSPLSRVMTTEPVFVYDDANLDHVIALMIENGVRRIPVVSKTERPRKCIGIVALDDLIVAKAISLDDVGKIVDAQVTPPHGKGHRDAAIEERHDARAEQTINRFYNIIADKTGLEKNLAVRAVWLTLANLYRAVPEQAAKNFACQLPKNLREQLLALPPGPDRTVTPALIKQEVARHLTINAAEAEELAKNITLTLEDLMGEGELYHFRGQLPLKLRSLVACRRLPATAVAQREKKRATGRIAAMDRKPVKASAARRSRSVSKNV